jgi:hypothetical protein
MNAINLLRDGKVNFPSYRVFTETVKVFFKHKCVGYKSSWCFVDTTML